MLDKNAGNFTEALGQAAGKVGPAAVDIVSFAGQTIKIENPKIPSGAPRWYVKEVSGAGRLSLNFHFVSGTGHLDENASGDLDRLVELLANPTYQHRAVLLFGFSDNAGRARKNIALSKDRARAVADQLQMRGIKPSFVNGFGKALPVASNNTEDGREKNRRVEVWLR
jgi:phosphate transport system substrate-binding protein